MRKVIYDYSQARLIEQPIGQAELCNQAGYPYKQAFGIECREKVLTYIHFSGLNGANCH